MTDNLFSSCPKCKGQMESGLLATSIARTSGIGIKVKCSQIFWSEQYKMGFLGSPKGETVSNQNTHKKYMSIPAERCPFCRFVAFTY